MNILLSRWLGTVSPVELETWGDEWRAWTAMVMGVTSEVDKILAERARIRAESEASAGQG